MKKYLLAMWSIITLLLTFSLFATCVLAQQETRQVKVKTLDEMGLEELLNIEIISASNKAEKLSDAPATVIVLTKKDILKRGYLEMSEIFDDLPGMDVIRAYGDTYSKNYWRGYRNNIGSPYLLMVDNIIQNNMYFNEAEGISALPLSNVERIEIVYGPASSVYGPNAFMGVINVITIKDDQSNGIAVHSRLSAGSLKSRIADVNLMYKKDDFRVSLTGRFDEGVIDTTTLSNYEYTKPKYLRDRRLWGAFLDNPNLGGNPQSPHENSAIDARVYLGSTEAGFLYSAMRTGYGPEYPFDQVQPSALWSRPQWSLHLRHTQQFNDKFSSTTFLRFRESDVANDSYFVEGYPATVQGGRVVDFSYWQALCSSISVYQDFNYKATDALSFNAGLKYERRDLQKAYDNPYSASLEPAKFDVNKDLPAPPVDTRQYRNRIFVIDQGIYLQGKYQIKNILGLDEEHNFTAGLRIDDNSVYGQASTIRAGYVGNFGKLGVKLLYGEAFQEPTPRLLFGGWRGSGSDPALSPELSKTLEGSVSYTTQYVSGMVNAYFIQNDSTIVNVAGGAKNLGVRKVSGVDIHLQALVPVSFMEKLSIWGYVSFISSEEKQVVKGAITDNVARIGDLADVKFYLGATADITQDLSVTLRSRSIGKRITVSTNPLGQVDSYFTMDANILYSNLFAKGFGVALRMTNIFDAQYFHPGVRTGGAGNTPGTFTNAGVWVGSKDGDFYSSLLPQPGRAVQLSFIVDM